MESLVQDLRFAFRTLLKLPALTAVALTVLTVGIGATSAVFSIVNSVLIEPLPYRDPKRLVMIWQSVPKIPGWALLGGTAPDYLDYRDRTRSFSALAGFETNSYDLTGISQPERVDAALITANLFPLLGAWPLLGRSFSREEEQRGREHVAILSYGLWQRAFGGDPGVLNRIIKLNETPYTVVGVMHRGFEFPYEGTPFSERAELWLPLAFAPQDMQNRVGSYDVRLLGGLRSGITLEQAQADITAVAEAFQQEHPEAYNGGFHLTARVVPLQQVIVGDMRRLLWVLVGAVGFVLLIACANVANLLLVRATARKREIAIRLSLGATRTRLLRQLVTESTLLALAGGGAGLAFAFAAVRGLRLFGSARLPRLEEASIDSAVAWFTLGAALVSGLLFGIEPAFRARRVDVGGALKDAAAQSGSSREQDRLRHVLVILESAAALVLLTGAGLLMNSFLRVLRTPAGFDPNHVLVARTALDLGRYPDPVRRNLAEREMIARLRKLPGVDTSAAATLLPLADARSVGVHLEGEPPNQVHAPQNNLVSPGFFRAMGIRLLKGRDFSDRDEIGTPLVAVVDEKSARSFWHDEALGKHFEWNSRLFTVVGVVEDIRATALDQSSRPTFYMPMFQVQSGVSTRAVMIVRSFGDPALLAPVLRREIGDVDKGVPVYGVATMNEIVAKSLEQRRFALSLLTAFAVIALMLAAIGLYGVMSYTIAQRSRELAVRSALGAQGRQLLVGVLRQGLGLSFSGILFGLVLGAMLTRFLSGLLFEVKPLDPLSFAAACALLTLASLLGCLVPARRTLRVDPAAVLRNE